MDQPHGLTVALAHNGVRSKTPYEGVSPRHESVHSHKRHCPGVTHTLTDDLLGWHNAAPKNKKVLGYEL